MIANLLEQHSWENCLSDLSHMSVKICRHPAIRQTGSLYMVTSAESSFQALPLFGLFWGPSHTLPETYQLRSSSPWISLALSSCPSLICSAPGTLRAFPRNCLDLQRQIGSPSLYVCWMEVFTGTCPNRENIITWNQRLTSLFVPSAQSSLASEMAGIQHRYRSPPSRPTDEIEDWPIDEHINPRRLPKLQISSGMERASHLSFLSDALEQEWPTDDDLEGRFLDARSSPSSTLDRDMSTTETEESGTDGTGITSPERSLGPVIDLTARDVIVDRTVNDVIDLTDDMEIDEPSGAGLRPSMSVELVDGSYLRIERIFRENGEELLRGRYLLQTTDRRVSAYVPKVRGELIWVTSLVGHVPVEHVKRMTEIHFTNARFNWQPHSGLLCRLKFAESLRMSTTTRRHERVYEPERSVEHLSFHETDDGYGWTSMELRNDWRGSTTPFGEAERPPTPSTALTSGPAVIDLTDDPIDLTGARDRAYTFGDAFCGAGGTSCGARQAGLSVRWGSDRDKHAVETYKLNFDADVYHASFDQLMAMPASELRADVVHCSPPCQPFSPAHTVNNQLNDEQNSACIFAARNLLQLARPRILTMEETAGLQERHGETLQRVILDIVEEGCSVRWSVLDTFHYGVPQCRKRLVVIAAG